MFSNLAIDFYRVMYKRIEKTGTGQLTRRIPEPPPGDQLFQDTRSMERNSWAYPGMRRSRVKEECRRCSKGQYLPERAPGQRRKDEPRQPGNHIEKNHNSGRDKGLSIEVSRIR